MKVLFVSRTQSAQKDLAYNHRLLMLQQGLQRLGMKADFLYLGDWIRPYVGDWIRPYVGRPPSCFRSSSQACFHDCGAMM